MSSVSLHPSTVFGFRSDVNDNVCFLDDQNVIYPAGANIVIYNTDHRTQKFIPATEGLGKFTCMTVSPNRRYVAVAEKNERPSVSVYDLQTMKRRKTLTLGDDDTTTQEFVVMAFAPDSKYLVTVGAAPDCTLHFWMWEKSRGPIALLKCAPLPEMSVRTVAFHPQDATCVSVVGPGVFRLLRYVDNTIKVLPFHKLDAQSFLCQAWLSDERMVIGTDNGRVLLFDGTDQKAELHLYTDDRNKTARVECFGTFSRGFLCGDSYGAVHVFERADDRDQYHASRVETLPELLPGMTQIVKHVALSPSEDVMVCSTDKMQMYKCALVKLDENKSDGGLVFLSQPFHFGAVTGLDVCVRKPLVVTCSVDSSVRVWNYRDNTLDLFKFFGEEAYAVSMHPSGLHVLVAFSDKLRFMNLLNDDIRPAKEFNIRGCRECRFSNGGHLFAAVYGNIVQIFSTYTMENVGNLKGHNGKVRSLSWSVDDMRIVSCGLDGAIYEWSIQTFQRVAENVLKSCSYTCAILSADSKSVFAVGSDKTLKELQQCQIVNDIPSTNKAYPNETVLTQVAISSSGRALVAGLANGGLRSVKLPLNNPGEWVSQAGHSGTVAKLRMSHDDSTLFSVGEDGCLIVCTIVDKDMRTKPNDHITQYSEDVLIGKADLEDKISATVELTTRVEELKMANEYQMRLKDISAADKVKEVSDKLNATIEQLKGSLESLKSDKAKGEAAHDEETAMFNEKFQQELHDLENQHAQKLLSEYEKCQNLEQRCITIQGQGEEKLRALDASKTKALEELAGAWQERLESKMSALDLTRTEMTNQGRDYEECARQVEIDLDGEILALKNKYERLLKDERDGNLRLKGDNGILKNKLKGLSSEVDENHKHREDMETEQKRLQSHIKSLERDLGVGKKEIEERDETIQDKEKRIYDLKIKNQELEKFKFVLDYKIKELKKQIEPRELEIQEMKVQVTKMDNELATYHSVSTSLTLQLGSLQSKLTVSEDEERALREKNLALRTLIQRFRSDIQLAVSEIQNPKGLQACVKTLNKKYCGEKVQDSSLLLDEELQMEHNRQREFLERSIATLRTQLAKNSEAQKTESVRIMKENVLLIKEINDLRVELSGTKSIAKGLEGTLRSTQKLRAMQGHTLDLSASLSQSALTPADYDEIDQLGRIVAMQKDEIRRLRDDSRPNSTANGQRLPSLGATVF